MGMFDNIQDKAEQLKSDHPDQVEKASDQAIERGGDAADKASGNKYDGQIDSAQKKADDTI